MPRPSDMERRVREVQREIAERDDVQYPLRTDRSLYGAWLAKQRLRRDRVGGLAKVAWSDPFWPGGDKSREDLRRYFRAMNSREFVLMTLDMTFHEFDVAQDTAKRRAKNKAAKASRRKNRQRH